MSVAGRTVDKLPAGGSRAVARPARVVRLKVITEDAKPGRRRRPASRATLEDMLSRPSFPRKLRGGVRPMSMGRSPLTPGERAELHQIEAELSAEGIRLGPPPTFGECPPGPCGHASCRHHLALEVMKNNYGNYDQVRRTPAVLKVNRPGTAIGDSETCSLRVAAAAALRLQLPRGRTGQKQPYGATPLMSFEEIGRLLGITVERVRQIEQGALAKLRVAGPPALGAG